MLFFQPAPNRSLVFCYHKFMNSLWLARICKYRNSQKLLEMVKKIIEIKILGQGALLKRYGGRQIYSGIGKVQTVQEVLLEEARCAKIYWHHFKFLLPLPFREFFTGRKAHSSDMVNRLLDIGYHHLSGAVKRTLDRLKIPSEVGLLHEPHRADSTPLVYDIVEMFRSDIVDAEVLRLFRLKKKVFTEIKQNDIARFVHNLNKRLEKKHYFSYFRCCYKYSYYVELQIQAVVKAVNHNDIFRPIILPTRHENRCS